MPIGILGKFMRASRDKEQNLIHLPAEVHFGVAACIDTMRFPFGDLH